MRKLRAVHFGLVSFFGILTLSAATIVTHAMSPNYAKPLQTGERVPAFALPDQTGVIREVATNHPHGRYMLIVYAPHARLDEPQRQSVWELYSTLATTAAVDLVAITSDAEVGCDPTQIFPEASTVLIDRQRSLWSLTGTNANEASVCLIDRSGKLRYRSRIPPEDLPELEGQPLVKADRQLMVQDALASVR